MNLTVTRLLTGVLLAGSVALVAACSSPSLSPTGPSVVASAASAAAPGANFSPNPDFCTEFPNDPSCQPPPPPPPEGTPCSPGYWKNHETEFAAYCVAAAAIPNDPFSSCADLFAAITCKGSNASCGRSAAAAALNTVSACVED